MNELKTWNYESSEIRTIEVNGEPWFVLADICKVLELSNPSKVAQRLDEDEKSNFELGLRGSAVNCINESGLYAVILRSDKPQAKPFRKWVTSEVLPSIRKHGVYVPEQKQLTPIEMIASIANNAVETERRLKLAEAKQQEQETAIANTNQRIDNMCEILSFDRNTWRKDSRRIVSKIASITGENYSFIYDEIYDLLEERAECDLRMRLDNKYDRMSERGVCKSKLDKLNYLDVIEDDKKLIEIYIAIVKDLAIKYGVCL